MTIIIIGQLDPATWQPPLAAASCGNNKALYKAWRWHPFLDAGIEWRMDLTTGLYRRRRVLICDRCGRERDVRP